MTPHGSDVRWYFTGRPCLRGHIAKRWKVNGTCSACGIEKDAARRALNLESAREKDRLRYWRDVEKKRQQMRESRHRHLLKRRASDHSRYHDDAVRCAATKARAVAWGRLNPGKRNAIVAARRAWIKQATPPWLTPEHRRAIRLLYIEASRREGDWQVDHIYPLRGKNSCGLNVPWNLQIITGDENRKKGNRI